MEKFGRAGDFCPNEACQDYGKIRVQFGRKSKVLALLGRSTAYIERNNLTGPLFKGRQVRKTLAFST